MIPAVGIIGSGPVRRQVRKVRNVSATGILAEKTRNTA